MSVRKPVIAIDGYSSTGKSSISKIIAQKLGLIHMDTGALYRGVTLYANQNCQNENGEINIDCLIKNLSNIHLEFHNENNILVLYLNGKNITKDIRTPEISNNVSLVAKQPEVRNYLMEIQRNMAEKGGIIMDGRDIGTVVLPNADYKFFLTASIEERTRRRYNELKNMGVKTNLEEVMNNLKTRDKTDSERDVAPLKKAENAILIDNSELDKNETLQLIISYIL